MDAATKEMRGEYLDLAELEHEKADEFLVSINLSEVDQNEHLPDRIIILGHPDFSTSIGRGSQSDEAIEPGPNNAWFSSRVMSRHHAVLRADPKNQVLTIQDDNSMHGTFLNGERVGREPIELFPGDIVTLGAEVVRGEETYQPLKVLVQYDWQEVQGTPEVISQTSTNTFRNKFTVDFPEDDFDSDIDDDIQILSESVREPSVEILSPSSISKPALPPATSDHPILLTDLGSEASDEQEKTNSVVGERTHPAEHDSDFENDTQAASTQCDTTDEEGELEADSDGFDGEDEFADETEDKGSREEAESDIGPQSVQASSQAGPGLSVPSDNARREPSPSDAALARPRLSDFPPLSPLPQLPSTSAAIPPPPRSTLTPPIVGSYSGTSSMEKYPQSQVYFSAFNVQENPKPSHNFVPSYQYNPLGGPVYSVGNLNSYPSAGPNYAWNPWKMTTTYPNSQPPRPTSGWEPPVYNSSSSLPPSVQVQSPISMQQSVTTHEYTYTTASKGKKRTVGDLYEDSDGESVPSISTSESSHQKLGSTDAASSSSPITQATSEIGKDPELKPNPAEGEDEHFDQDGETSNEPPDVMDVDATSDKATQSALEPRPLEAVVQEPPRKKIKINEEHGVAKRSMVSTALKYTAAAFAGAAVGAVGTVVGLASLPPDFFA